MLDYIALHNTCNKGIERFREMGDYVPCTPRSGYTYIDNGSPILAVAHLDTVQNSRRFRVTPTRIFSPRLDDRLGVYIILRLLPLFGLKYDILLTEDEEDGNSTAQFFTPDKDYHWMFQFDRGGTDVVMYQYHTNDYEELIEAAGYVTGIGTYSDICELNDLECAGFNFGTGYYNPHSMGAYAIVKELELSVTKFVYFYNAHRHTHLVHDKTRVSYYDPYMWYDEDICPFCNTYLIPDGADTMSQGDADCMAMFGMCADCATWWAKYQSRITHLTDSSK